MKMKKKGFAIGAALIIAASTLVLTIRFPNLMSLTFSALTHQLPSENHLHRIRHSLYLQPHFRKMLVRHEQKTLARFRQSGNPEYTKLYLHKTDVSTFDFPELVDYWETWVKTDIVDGKPYTSFLIRLGVIKDPNAGAFFSTQLDGGFGKFAFQNALWFYNKLFDWGLFKGYRLNITESDKTSSVTRIRTKQA